MDFTDTQLLLDANIKYNARTLILRALVYVLVTFCSFCIKTYISSISAVFWSLFLCKINKNNFSKQNRLYKNVNL